MRNMSELRKLYKPIPFFGLDFILTWVPLWLLVIGLRRGWFEEGSGLLVFAGISATLSAVLFVHTSGKKFFIRDFWIRIIDPRRIGAMWWIIIFFSQLIINIAAMLLSVAGGEPLQQITLSEEFLQAPVGFLLFMLVFGPIPEELGWRGYGMDALRSRMNLLSASIVLGLIWGVWHFPLVFIEDSFQRGLLQYPPAFGAYFLAFFPVSILMSWIYYRTDRSTLSAILFHFAGNAAGELFHMSLKARVFQTALAFVFAMVVVLKEWPLFTRRDFEIDFEPRKNTEPRPDYG